MLAFSTSLRSSAQQTHMVVDLDDDPISNFSDDNAGGSSESYSLAESTNLPTSQGTDLPFTPEADHTAYVGAEQTPARVSRRLLRKSSGSESHGAQGGLERPLKWARGSLQPLAAGESCTPDRMANTNLPSAMTSTTTSLAAAGQSQGQLLLGGGGGPLQLVEGGSSSSTSRPSSSGGVAPPAAAAVGTSSGLPTRRLARPQHALNMQEDLLFQLIDICERNDEPPARFPQARGSSSRNVPILDLHGVTRDGRSVLLHVHGFRPYFYVQRPREAALGECIRAMRVDSGAPEHWKEVQRRPLTHYQAETQAFLQVWFPSTRVMGAACRSLESGVRLETQSNSPWRAKVFEANVQFPLRFMVDHNLAGGGWVKVGAGQFSPVSKKISRAQLEADVHFSQVHGCECDDLAPLRLLALQVTTVKSGSVSGSSQSADGKPFIVAAAVILRTHANQGPGDRRSWFVGAAGNGAVENPGSACRSEDELLMKLHDYIVNEADPDIIIGYDLLNKQLNDILQKAKDKGLRRGCYDLGRLHDVATRCKNTTFETRQLGRHESKDINMEGRLIFDILPVFEREHKLSSYSLSALVSHFLGESRLEVHHLALKKLAEEFPSKLAARALKDAELALKLFEGQSCLFRYVEMARVTGVPMEFLLTKGQSIKVFSMLLRKAQETDFVLPPAVRGSTAEERQSYEGGEVLDPCTGFYDLPVITLDFASLYPSIMQKHNLCYSTYIPSGFATGDQPPMETAPVVGHRFVESKIRKGLLPMVLEELLKARSKAKKEMKNASDPTRKAVLNGRQLALKVSANSVYGFTGMAAGLLPCQAIAESVTAYGRQMIGVSKKVIEDTFGETDGAKVIYGDTDSVMITLRPDIDMEAAFIFGKSASIKVTSEFGEFIKMEFEKVYSPFLLMGKKRYAGLAWAAEDNMPPKAGKVDIKGLEVVRRDWCDLVRHVEEKCLKMFLEDLQGGVERATSLVKETIQLLRQGKLDTRLLVLTKALSRDGEGDYKAKQPHVSVVEKMKQRKSESVPTVGQRVSFVYTASEKTAANERAEDPIYALEQGLAPDADYYLKHQLKEPLIRLFKTRLNKESSKVEGLLFQGYHVRRVASQPMRSPGKLTSFFSVQAKCVGCGGSLGSTGRQGGKEAALCSECSSPAKAPGYVLKQVNAARALEAEMSKLLSQCVQCEASVCEGLHHHCINIDCPIFFRRYQVRAELKASEESLEKLRRMSLDW